MKKRCFLLALLLSILFASVSAAQNECTRDSIFSEVGNCGYDVSDYRLDMEWKPEGDLWYVEETVTFRSEWDTDELSFDFIEGYEITSLTIDGDPAGYEQTENKLIVRHPGRGFAHDTEYKLYAAFHGKLQRVQSPWDPDDESRDQEKGFCMFNEPYQSRHFYICNDHPKDRAAYHYSFTVPAGFTPAGVGRLTEIREGNKVTPVNGSFERKQEEGPAEGTVTFTYTQEAESAPYLFAVCAEPFDLKQQILEDGKVQLDFVSRQIGDPENPVKDDWELYFEDEWENAPEYAWGVTEIQPAIIRALESYFGSYPYDDLGFILSGFDLGGALETQGRSILDIFDLDGEIASHEIAHQWVGDLISLADWSDLWIKEGAAEYGSVLWEEYKSENPDKYEDFVPYDEFMMRIYEPIANGETARYPVDYLTAGLRSYDEESTYEVLDHDAAVRSISAFCQIDSDQIRLKNGDITFEEYIEGLTNSCDTILYSEKSEKLFMELIGKPIDWDHLDMFAGPKESLSNDLDKFYSYPPYYGGAVLYHCLRVRLGDEVFFDALQTLIRENQGRTVNEEKFIEVFSRVSGEDLEEFIKSYLYYGENGHVPDLLGIETFEEAREKYKSVYPKDDPEPI